MNSIQKKINNLEWEKWREQVNSQLFSMPTAAALKRTLMATLLTGSLFANIVLYQMHSVTDAKLSEIYELAEMQGGWVYMEFDD